MCMFNVQPPVGGCHGTLDWIKLFLGPEINVV